MVPIAAAECVGGCDHKFRHLLKPAGPLERRGRVSERENIE
jgi:hypothetical protein